MNSKPHTLAPQKKQSSPQSVKTATPRETTRRRLLSSDAPPARAPILLPLGSPLEQHPFSIANGQAPLLPPPGAPAFNRCGWSQAAARTNDQRVVTTDMERTSPEGSRPDGPYVDKKALGVVVQTHPP